MTIDYVTTSKVPQNVKQNSKNRRKRTEVQKPKIEIKMAPHKTIKSAAVEYSTDGEDMIVYDVENDEVKPNTAAEFVMPDFF
ncbi:hypothetical protein TNCV_4418831 [Trichonephila clavipes]|nr:hypothetical protein TNCV_4418831 [Trichonephila clavipes]